MQTAVNIRQIKHLKKISQTSHAAHSKFITSKPNHYKQGLRYQTCSATGLSQDNPKVKHWSKFTRDMLIVYYRQTIHSIYHHNYHFNNYWPQTGLVVL